MPQVRGRSLAANLGSLADALHYLKLSFTKQLHSKTGFAGSFWQKRYCDRNVRDDREFMEKLRYLHRNPGSPASRFWLAGVEAGETRVGERSSGLEVEQLSSLSASGSWTSRNRIEMDGTGSGNKGAGWT